MKSLLLLGTHFFLQTLFGFSTAYVSFDPPEGWRWELAQGVWVGQSTVEADRKEAVVLSIATLAADWDSVENYEKYLKEPKTIQDEDGKTITSKMSYTKQRNINGNPWVDSLQLNSELPGFYARYLATTYTVNGTRLAVLLTYIVSEEKYTQFAPLFEKMVSSLKPNAEFDLNVSTKQGDGPLPGSDRLGQVKNDILKGMIKIKKPEPKAEEPPLAEDSDSTLMWVMVAVLGGGAFWWIKKRRQKKAVEAVAVVEEEQVPQKEEKKEDDDDESDGGSGPKEPTLRR